MNINEDIIELIWKNTKFSEYAKTALISRDFSKNLKNISEENKLKVIYDSKTTTEFIIYYTIKIANKYNYNFKECKICYTRKSLNKHYKYDKYKSIESVMIFCEYVELILHSLNRNYRILYKKLCNLKNKFNDIEITKDTYVDMISFILKQNLKSNEQVYNTKKYNKSTNTLSRAVVILLLFEINRMVYNRNIDDKKRSHILITMQSKKSNEFITILNKENYPKYLNNKILSMFLEHVNI
jgi:hypothetical protein